MPDFATASPQVFWESADQFERANGRPYRELVLTLPRELEAGVQRKLAKDAVKDLLGERFAYTFAIHRPQARDKEEQPHMHLMFSERVIDDRTKKLSPEEFFKRAGAKKDRDWHAYNKPGMVRQQWSRLVNATFKRLGLKIKVDSRTYEDQGRPEMAAVREPKGVRGREEEIDELRKTRKDIEKVENERSAIAAINATAQAKLDELRKQLAEAEEREAVAQVDAELIAILKDKKIVQAKAYLDLIVTQANLPRLTANDAFREDRGGDAVPWDNAKRDREYLAKRRDKNLAELKKQQDANSGLLGLYAKKDTPSIVDLKVTIQRDEKSLIYNKKLLQEFEAKRKAAEPYYAGKAANRDAVIQYAKRFLPRLEVGREHIRQREEKVLEQALERARQPQQKVIDQGQGR
jgi:hypothetical protein